MTFAYYRTCHDFQSTMEDDSIRVAERICWPRVADINGDREIDAIFDAILIYSGKEPYDNHVIIKVGGYKIVGEYRESKTFLR